MNIRYDWATETGASTLLPAGEGLPLARAFHGLQWEQRPLHRRSSLLIAVVAHLLLGWLIVYATMTVIAPAPREQTITVTLESAQAKPAPSVPQPPKVPVVPQMPQTVPPPQSAAPAIQIAATPAPVETAPPVQPSPPSPSVQKTPPEPQIIPPSFDAAYLKNPPTVYPNMSRRLRETGTVRLRVLVSADGQPLEILLASSSAYPRLDAAALDAVRKWRFQPASRNGTPVEAWVVVPVEFSLTRS